MDRKAHWDKVYSAKKPADLTWYQEEPATSLSLIRGTGLGGDARMIDVGGGTSRLTSFLLDQGFRKLAVLDVSEAAQSIAKTQLGERASMIEWLEADVLAFDPPHRWDLWHDRTVFHFLTWEEDRAAYCRTLNRALEPGGHLIVSTFALDGPTRCSGLEVVRYSPDSLHAVLGPAYRLRGSATEAHRTPSGGTQAFAYSWFQRTEER